MCLKELQKDKLEIKELVRFIVSLKNGLDMNAVKCNLERLAENLCLKNLQFEEKSVFPFLL